MNFNVVDFVESMLMKTFKIFTFFHSIQAIYYRLECVCGAIAIKLTKLIQTMILVYIRKMFTHCCLLTWNFSKLYQHYSWQIASEEERLCSQEFVGFLCMRKCDGERESENEILFSENYLILLNT